MITTTTTTRSSASSGSSGGRGPRAYSYQLLMRQAKRCAAAAPAHSSQHTASPLPRGAPQKQPPSSCCPHLVNHHLPWRRRQLWDNVPPGLATREQTSCGTGVTNAGANVARAPALVGWKVDQLGAVALACVDDHEPSGPQCCEHVPGEPAGPVCQQRARQCRAVVTPVQTPAATLTGWARSGHG
jgi:hypothetical protein